MKITKHLILGAVTLSLCLGTAANGRAQDQAPPKTDPGKSTPELLGDLKKTTETATDPELKSLGKDLGAKVGTLNTSLAGNTAAQGQLNSALGGLTGKSSPVTTLSSLQQLSQAKLTPDQTKLAKDVCNTGSAYLVQKHLGNVEGAQGDVANVVGALKKGTPSEALPSLKNIGQNAKLTDAQKGLVESMIKSQVPGLQKGEDLLNKIPSFGK
jgi:hypothetical protein